MTNISLINIWEGENTIIKAVQLDNRCPAEDCLKKLGPKDQTKVFALFKFFSQKRGEIINEEKVKKLKFSCAGCFEFKPTKQLRISFVYLKTSDYHIIMICLLDGFIKKQRKWPQNKIQKTENLCKQVKTYQKTQGGKV